MNDLLRASVRPRRIEGLVDRLKQDPIKEPHRAERFRILVAQHEAAIKAGDETMAAVYDDQLDQLFIEARNACEDESSEPPAPAAISFDGGVRRPVRRPRAPLNVLDAARVEMEIRQEARDRLSSTARRLSDTRDLR